MALLAWAPGCTLSLALSLSAARVVAAPGDYFRINVVDAETGRGVPLVELKTTSDVRFWTDSNGVAAINEPDMARRRVYFHVSSHGYEHAADGFGNRGAAFDVRPGGAAQIKIQRINIAERLYRLTGAGIYRDSALVGAPISLENPQLNGLVTGQDTVMATPYNDKIFWLWGDTNRPSYPLGNFFTSSATSLLPGRGGLDPGVGVNFSYWVDSEGFSKKMMPMEGNMPVWLSALFAIPGAGGREYLFAKYAQVKSDSKVSELGLAEFNDGKAVFEKVLASNAPLFPDGHPFHATVNRLPYVYFQATGTPEIFPLVRVRALREHVTDPGKYEGFTCLAAGSRFEGAQTRLERGADGKLIFGWKVGTPPLLWDQRRELIEAGKMKAEEVPFSLRDIQTDAPIRSHGGSVFWNAFRQKWVAVSGQAGGSTSYLGEIWYAEADTPVGPWGYARKVVTHNKYTFYNPTQHPFFDQDGGRLIYFEGTYTSTYSGNEDKTPRYDYNQMMYRLALDDARLALPAPVYAIKAGGALDYAMREGVEARRAWASVQSVPFFAIAPGRASDRARKGLIPVYAAAPNAGAKNTALQLSEAGGAKPLFYALPPGVQGGEKPSPAVVPVWEHSGAGGARWYSTAEKEPGATRGATPAFRAWRNPTVTLVLDAAAKAKP